MQRYKVFARQAAMPTMNTTTQPVLEIGKVAKADVSRLAEVSAQEKQALATLFEVPVGVIDGTLQRMAAAPPSSADQLAESFRTAVVDYRFLRGEWDRYHPPAEGQPTRQAALEALQAGDLTKAWKLYDGLRKPQAPAIAAPAPPANLRVVATP
jgi:hypothetical protein